MRSRTFGQNLREIREELGLSQTEVGEALGVASSRISQIEKGTGIRGDDLVRLVRFYGVPMDVFGRSPANLTVKEVRAIRLFKDVLDSKQRAHIVNAIDSFVKNECIREHRFQRPVGQQGHRKILTAIVDSESN